MAVDRRKPKPAQQGPWLPVLLFCLVLGVFLPCLRNGFVSLDDPLYVSNNPHVGHGLTWGGLKWAWSSTEAQNWHPVTWFSHLADCQLFGLHPEGHHATSILLHAANTVLLFLLLQRMTGARWRSFVVAALFGLHPLRVESVAWISERKDVLSTMFWLLTIWAYVRFVKIVNYQLSIINYFFCLLFFALGLMSKPMLVTLPFVLLLLDYWPLRRWAQIPASRLWLEKIPFFALAAADSVVTFEVQRHGGAITTLDTLSLPLRLANAMVSCMRYLGKTAWPVDLCVLYPYQGKWPALTVAGAGFVLAAVSALALWRCRAMPYLAVGWFWFLGTLAPVIGLVQAGRQGLADRFTYIPSIGLFIAMVWGAAKLTEPWRNRETLARSGMAAALVVCIALTVHQIGFWKDSKTLFEHAVNVTQRNWIAAASLADALQAEGKADEAMAIYQQSLQINPHYKEARYKWAALLLGRRRFEESLAQFQQGVDLDPDDVNLRQGLGAVLQDMGRLDEAIEQFKQVLQIKPDDADTFSNLGNCYGLKGRADDALRCLAQAVKLKPQSAQNHRELGVGLERAGHLEEAMDQYRQAVQLDPSDMQARRLLEAAVKNKTKATQPPATPPSGGG